jgi:hypothetical protein
MNHDEAIRVLASEKYLLDELAVEERDRFEEHLFGCPDCAVDVRAGAVFIDQAASELSMEPRVSLAPAPIKLAWWMSFLRPAVAVPAMAVLLALVTYQTFFEVPRLHRELAASDAPQILASASLINVNSRGGSKASITVKPGEAFLLFVDLPAESRFSSYVAELRDSAGTLQWSLPISSEAARDTLFLRIPSGRLEAGPNTVIVRGVSGGQEGPEIGRFPFQLEFQPR